MFGVFTAWSVPPFDIELIVGNLRIYAAGHTANARSCLRVGQLVARRAPFALLADRSGLSLRLHRGECCTEMKGASSPPASGKFGVLAMSDMSAGLAQLVKEIKLASENIKAADDANFSIPRATRN
jgi:hypothetical protein